MEPKVREYLTRLREEAFLQIKDGYIDSGAAPGKDTRWQDVAQLKPQTTTKEEVASRIRNPKKLFGLIPIPGTTRASRPGDGSGRTPAHKPPKPERPAAAAKTAAAHAAHPTMKSPYVNELKPNQVDHHQFPGSLQGDSPEEDRRTCTSRCCWATAPASWTPRCGTTSPKVMDDLRPRRFRQGQGPGPDLPQPAAAHHPQGAADGRQRNRFRRLLPLLAAATRRRCGRNCAASWRPSANPHLKALLEALLDDEDMARRYRRAPAAKQIHHAFLGGLLEHVLSLCALARAVAAALSEHRLRPAADRRGAARYRQDLRAELRARLLLLRRRATARPHHHRPAHGGRQAARPAGFSAAAAHRWWST